MAPFVSSMVVPYGSVDDSCWSFRNLRFSFEEKDEKILLSMEESLSISMLLVLLADSTIGALTPFSILYSVAAICTLSTTVSETALNGEDCADAL